ncbi:MAG: zinc-finger domain-containing protein [Gammaproteobacteria bacterium]|nr:zinc-finger domain-containing protein [Gammaproteobacteria bacterium]
MSEATATARKVIEVSRKQLPLSCPNAGTNPAELHPRVYIPLKKGGERVSCPYCGAVYQLKD